MARSPSHVAVIPRHYSHRQVGWSMVVTHDDNDNKLAFLFIAVLVLRTFLPLILRKLNETLDEITNYLIW